MKVNATASGHLVNIINVDKYTYNGTQFIKNNGGFKIETKSDKIRLYTLKLSSFIII